MDIYEEYTKGVPVDVIDVIDDNEEKVISGIIMSAGSAHVVVNDYVSGENYEVPYEMLRSASIEKKAQAEVIKEDEIEAGKFVLTKSEENIDGSIGVKYVINKNEDTIWESEKIITNTYDKEKGWTAPDDFDDSKLDLLQQKAEQGFDLLVESYDTIREQVEEELAGPPAEGVPGEDVKEEGKPAFAPGAEPPAEGGAGAGGVSEAVPVGGKAGEPSADEALEEEIAEEATEEGVEEEPAAPVEETASLEEPSTSFARNILSNKKQASELLRNPEHRINPLLRSEMESRGIPSGETHDIALSEELKDYEYDAPLKHSMKRLENKIENLVGIKLGE